MIVGVELELINVLPEDQSIVEATRAIETCSASSRLIRLLQSHQVSDFLEPDASSILRLGSCHALVVHVKRRLTRVLKSGVGSDMEGLWSLIVLHRHLLSEGRCIVKSVFDEIQRILLRWSVNLAEFPVLESSGDLGSLSNTNVKGLILATGLRSALFIDILSFGVELLSIAGVSRRKELLFGDIISNLENLDLIGSGLGDRHHVS